MLCHRNFIVWVCCPDRFRPRQKKRGVLWLDARVWLTKLNFAERLFLLPAFRLSIIFSSRV